MLSDSPELRASTAAARTKLTRLNRWQLGVLIVAAVVIGTASGCAPATSNQSAAPADSAGQSAAEDAVAVPNVTGATLEAAQQTLSDAGFAPIVARDPSETVASGTVIAQLPVAGAAAAPSTGVGIAVSTGPVDGDPVLVPDVEGTPLGEARGALAEQGFEPLPVPENPDPGAGDLVTKQFPAAADQVQAGASILLLHAQE